MKRHNKIKAIELSGETLERQTGKEERKRFTGAEAEVRARTERYR